MIVENANLFPRQLRHSNDFSDISSLKFNQFRFELSPSPQVGPHKRDWALEEDIAHWTLLCPALADAEARPAGPGSCSHRSIPAIPVGILTEQHAGFFLSPQGHCSAGMSPCSSPVALGDSPGGLPAWSSQLGHFLLSFFFFFLPSTPPPAPPRPKLGHFLLGCCSFPRRITFT